MPKSSVPSPPDPQSPLKLPRPSDFVDPNLVPPDDVLRAIGYIAAVAAGIEDTLHGIYWRYSGLTEAKGPIITGDMRPNRMMEDILKLAQIHNIDKDKISALRELFTDLKILTTLRNQCIHWIWAKSDATSHKVYSPVYKMERKEIRFTTEDLYDLALDLAWIEVRLDSYQMTEAALQKKRAKLKDEKDIYAPAPWLDTPPPPNPKPGTRP